MKGLKRTALDYNDNGKLVYDWVCTCQRCGKVDVESFPADFKQSQVLQVLWCNGWYYKPSTKKDFHCLECEKAGGTR